jgi:hypothetical protein
MTDFWYGLDGARVETRFVACLHCGARDGVMLQHHCKDELELYCDWCERWTGHRITKHQVRAWGETGAGAGAPEQQYSRWGGIAVSRDMSRQNDPSGTSGTHPLEGGVCPA